MKNVLPLVVLSLLAVGSPLAHSSTITYRYTMTVEHMFEYDGTTGATTSVAASTLPGARFANGDLVEGSFSFSDAMPLTGYQPAVPASGSYQMYGGGITSDLKFIGSGWTYRSNSDAWQSNMQVADNASTFFGSDIFYMETASAYSPIKFESMVLNLFDNTGAVFSSSGIPAYLDLSKFSYNNLDYGWLRQSDGSQMHASGRLTSLSLDVLGSSVPVAPSSALVLIGMGALLWSRRRDRAGT